MAKNRIINQPSAERVVNIDPNPKQREFLLAKTRFVAYGGARGGGKSWAVRTKAMLLALKHGGIRILIMRRTLPELRSNHIDPLQKELLGVAKYHDRDSKFIFPNGSLIRFGYCDTERDVDQYQGQEYDIIFMDEATHFTEAQFDAIRACNRSPNDFPCRFYITCNPGGVGHAWVKRLFIDKHYTEKENPNDYTFIPALVYDNKYVMEKDPNYVNMLETQTGDRRRAWLDGDWDIIAGQFFDEFKRDLHVIEPFAIPQHWSRMAALDYGLDMLACLWVALDESGRGVVYREVYEPGLLVSQAAERLRPFLRETDGVIFAPHDLWGRSADTGKSQAEAFGDSGVDLLRVKAMGRVDGWMAIKEWLAAPDGKPGLQFFSTCTNIIRTLPLMQHDDRNPNDCAGEPHEITHAPDALRYLLAGRPLPAQKPTPIQSFDFSALKPTPSPVEYGERMRVV